MDLLIEQRAEIERHIRALGWLADDDELLALDKPGEGNMNRTLRATTKQGTLILKQSLNCVAKYPHIPAPIERLEVERLFYAAVSQHDALSLRVPQVLGYDARHHLLALEDLGDGGDLSTLYQSRTTASDLRAGEITGLVYWLWKLHALPIEDEGPFGNQAMRSLNHAHIFEVPLDADNGVALTPGLEAMARELRADPGVRATAEQLGEIYLGRQPHQSRPALLHGDFYPGSWLSHPTLGAAVIDPEFAFIGPPEFDLGVMIAHLMFCDYGEQDLSNILRSYVTPPGFEFSLAMRFAGMEIIRRLLGVAQLPLREDDSAKINWLNAARSMLAA